MIRVNRESPADAQKIIDEFISNEADKHEILSFLSEAIILANNLNPKNWNLNLDKDGGFVRLNVGQEYCIEIFEGRISILALKEFIQEGLRESQLDITFKGYNGRKKILSSELDGVPDCLAKVPGSVACYVKNHDVKTALPYLREANKQFILFANSHTTQRPLMIQAHSTGFISYLSEYFQKYIPNPSYTGEVEFQENFVSESRNQRNGAGFGNSETNRKVEQAAISFVTDEYKENGWIVKSVETEKCGFDLLCTKADKQECVEVKGIQGEFVSFIVTAGEVRQSQINKSFILCVVTSALIAPKLHKFTAKEFNEQFSLETISYRASLKQK
ncbi:MAG: DUF3883 domain-containing protein [Chloroflexi bacterium]|nr:DUF3883 domain-containing protein [Chloroflexota bacterium]NOG76959.1 DUF3883 domain-containing protein [Chloroflexota bacterium]